MHGGVGAGGGRELHYAYDCPRCSKRVDRYQVLVAERDDQVCECGGKLEFVLIPTRAKAVVWANDRNNSGSGGDGGFFTGPRQKARQLKERGLIDCGNESPESTTRHLASIAESVERKRDEETERVIMEGIQDLGESLYTTEPEQFETFARVPDDTYRGGPVDESEPEVP